MPQQKSGLPGSIAANNEQRTSALATQLFHDVRTFLRKYNGAVQKPRLNRKRTPTSEALWMSTTYYLTFYRKWQPKILGRVQQVAFFIFIII